MKRLINSPNYLNTYKIYLKRNAYSVTLNPSDPNGTETIYRPISTVP